MGMENDDKDFKEVEDIKDDEDDGDSEETEDAEEPKDADGDVTASCLNDRPKSENVPLTSAYARKITRAIPPMIAKRRMCAE